MREINKQTNKGTVNHSTADLCLISIVHLELVKTWKLYCTHLGTKYLKLCSTQISNLTDCFGKVHQQNLHDSYPHHKFLNRWTVNRIYHMMYMIWHIWKIFHLDMNFKCYLLFSVKWQVENYRYLKFEDKKNKKNLWNNHSLEDKNVYFQ